MLWSPPKHKIISLLLHNCNFTVIYIYVYIYSYNINVRYAGYLIYDPVKMSFDSLKVLPLIG